MNDPERYDDFTQIVEENNLRDILIPIAADDNRMKRVMRWLLVDPTYPEWSEQADYDDIIDLVRREYGLRLEQVDEMLNLCENNLVEELNHGH